MEARDAVPGAAGTEELAEQIKLLRARVDRIEAQLAADLRDHGAAALALGTPATPGPVEPPPMETAPAIEALASTQGLALLGRTLVAFGGAFLLRALTDGNQVAPPIGVALGLGYAGLMLVLADRAARGGARASAGFHGFTGAVIGTSLIWETSTRLHSLPPLAGSAALIALLALGLEIARRRKLQVVAWCITLCGALSAFALIVGAPSVMPFIVALFALGAAVEALAFDDRWMGLRWPAAIALDVATFHLANLAVHADWMPEGRVPLWPPAVVVAELALPSLYIVGVAVRSMLRGRLIKAFGMGQSVAALAIGLWGAARVLHHYGKPPVWVGAVALLLGAMGYAVAFGYAVRIRDRQRNFHFYATVGLLLLLVGAALAVPPVALPFAWLGLAIATALYRGEGAGTARVHAAVFVAVAVASSGALAQAWAGLSAPADAAWPPLAGATLLVLAGAALCYGLLVRAIGGATPGRAAEAPAAPPVNLDAARLVVAAAAGFSILGLVAASLARLQGAGAGVAADAAAIATTRTGVLALAAVLLGLGGRRFRLRELTWLVYPILAGGAVKLIAEDILRGRPSTLFLALALYGGALIITSRTIRREP